MTVKLIATAVGYVCFVFMTKHLSTKTRKLENLSLECLQLAQKAKIAGEMKEWRRELNRATHYSVDATWCAKWGLCCSALQLVCVVAFFILTLSM